MRTYLRIFLGLLTMITLVPRAAHAQEWERFRGAYRYHIQAIALSSPHGDGSRTLILSEPPPSLSFADITTFDPAFQEAETHRLRLGVDGWVKDVVIHLPALEPAQLNSLIDRLQIRLFGTSYKAYVIPIPNEAPSGRRAALNLHVTSGDLKDWLMGGPGDSWWTLGKGLLLALVIVAFAVALFAAKRFVLAVLCLAGAGALLIATSGQMTLAMVGLIGAVAGIPLLKHSRRVSGIAVTAVGLSLLVYGGSRLVEQYRGPETAFSPLLGGENLNCAAILRQQKDGVFLSTKPGLVLWSFSSTRPLADRLVEIREFSLDSDLILGAVASGNRIAVIGRERSTPVSMLPPLRAETILLLAGSKEDELAQSYERTNPFSGRYDSVGLMDWAPIYLSPRLIDTEYGSLMNITDQLLKGWSMHDTVRYVNFPYPKPDTYPFDKDLMDVLGTRKLTFNWNTKGAGYVTKAGDFEIYALNQTGSLPIDYLAQGKPDVQQAEDKAYTYYSRMSDPNLIRVVQYAAIYQIFHHYSIKASDTEQPAPQPEPSPLVEPMRAFLEDLPDLITAVVDRVPDQELKQEFTDTRRDLQLFERDDPTGELLNKLAQALATRDNFSVLDSLPEDQRQALMTLLSEVQSVGPYLLPAEARKALLARFTLQADTRQSRWIHTPSIVESRGYGQVRGGHNLSSKVTNFVADSSVAKGDVTVEQTASGRVIHFNPHDERSIGSTVRQAARDDQASPEEVERRVKATLVSEDVKPQPFERGLGFTDSLRPDPLRGFQSVHAPGSVDGIGWRRGGESISSKDLKMIRRLGGDDTRAVLVARNTEGVYLISAPPAEPIQAYDLASSTDAFVAVTANRTEKSVSVHFRGFDDRQAEGFVRNLDEHSEVNLKIASTEEEFTPDELAEILGAKYDWEQARLVKRPEVVTLPDSTRELHTELSVPSREVSRPGLVVQIRIKLSQAFEVTQNFLNDFAQLLQSRFTTSGDQDARIVAQQLVAELKTDHRFVDVRAQVKHDGKTVFYVEKRKGDGPWDQATDFAA